MLLPLKENLLKCKKTSKLKYYCFKVDMNSTNKNILKTNALKMLQNNSCELKTFLERKIKIYAKVFAYQTNY